MTIIAQIGADPKTRATLGSERFEPRRAQRIICPIPPNLPPRPTNSSPDLLQKKPPSLINLFAKLPGLGIRSRRRIRRVSCCVKMPRWPSVFARPVKRPTFVSRELRDDGGPRSPLSFGARDMANRPLSMKLMALLALFLCVPCFGQDVDGVQGFRGFRLGSKPSMEALTGGLVASKDDPDQSMGDVDVEKLTERTLWGQKIRRIILDCWKDQLYWIDIQLEPIPVDRDAVKPETTETLGFVNSLRANYGEPGKKEYGDHRISLTWDGKIVLMGYVSSRHRGEDTVVASLAIASKPVMEAMQAALKAEERAKAMSRKDGL
jgi:hypothetical protein